MSGSLLLCSCSHRVVVRPRTIPHLSVARRRRQTMAAPAQAPDPRVPIDYDVSAGAATATSSLLSAIDAVVFGGVSAEQYRATARALDARGAADPSVLFREPADFDRHHSNDRPRAAARRAA